MIDAELAAVWEERLHRSVPRPCSSAKAKCNAKAVPENDCGLARHRYNPPDLRRSLVRPADGALGAVGLRWLHAGARRGRPARLAAVGPPRPRRGVRPVTRGPGVAVAPRPRGRRVPVVPARPGRPA